MRLALLGVLAVLASGCGSGPAEQRVVGPPPGKLQQRNGPPRTWLETSNRNRWLAAGSSCWQFKGGNLCADMAAPDCEQPPIPHFRVARGERVRAHLGFTPDEASLDGKAGAKAVQLHGRVLEWKISKGGIFSVVARGQPGDASYSGCADLTS